MHRHCTKQPINGILLIIRLNQRNRETIEKETIYVGVMHLETLFSLKKNVLYMPADALTTNSLSLQTIRVEVDDRSRDTARYIARW